MIEAVHSLSPTIKISEELLQLQHIKGESVFMTDPEGNRMEFKTTSDGTSIVFTRDESGRAIAIEERADGTRLYHISKDNTGLPSSHELRAADQAEIVYFYNSTGNLQHFVELRPNGDRVSTIISENSIYSMEQRQIGGILFKAWISSANEKKEGMVWLLPDGEVTLHGDTDVVDELFTKFSRFLDGVRV